MDQLTDYLWGRVERGDGAGLLARALNTPAVRDALLREAALRDRWDDLAVAAEQAAAASPQTGWSRGGSDTVAAICHWVLADRALSSVPASDRAAALADAVRSAWNNPDEVAAAIANSAPLNKAAAEGFNADTAADAVFGTAAELLADLDDQLDTDPELIAYAMNNDAVRDALLRQTARSGQWADLLEAATHARQAAANAGSSQTGPAAVAAVCLWMQDDPAAPAAIAELGEHPLATQLRAAVSRPALVEYFATSPRLDEIAAFEFTRSTDRAFAAADFPEPPGASPSR